MDKVATDARHERRFSLKPLESFKSFVQSGGTGESTGPVSYTCPRVCAPPSNLFITFDCGETETGMVEAPN